jgi:hypothetical protein
MMLSLDTAYRFFGGEVEASSTSTISRLSDSRSHQLSAIAPPAHSQALRTSAQRSSDALHVAELEASVADYVRLWVLDLVRVGTDVLVATDVRDFRNNSGAAFRV